jgi:hypothetical protein
MKNENERQQLNRGREFSKYGHMLNMNMPAVACTTLQSRVVKAAAHCPCLLWSTYEQLLTRLKKQK